jgi:thiol-disulfide isomerase/thioredoxin
MEKGTAITLIIALIIIFIILIAYVSSMSESMANGKRTVALHYTNWCGACKNFKPIWYTVKARAANSGIIFIEIDEEKTPTPGIAVYPTILMKDELGNAYRYSGEPDVDKFYAWVMAPIH